MHILGLSNGTPAGNSEILLKAALSAAKETNPSLTTSWVHIPSISIPLRAGPLKNTQDPSMGLNVNMSTQTHPATDKTALSTPDDRAAVLDAILDADALIFSTPVYSHQPAGTLKHVFDKILGPFADAAFAQRTYERQQQGDPAYKDQYLDKRLLKPRVVGFMCAAGSGTPDQISLALPSLHLLVYCLHATVIDQFVSLHLGAPGVAAIADGGEPVKRAQQLGRNIASQMGKSFDDAIYLGPEPRGACPWCHLAKFELLNDKDNCIGCVTCGNEGELVVGANGLFEPLWRTDSDYCCISMRGKTKHLDDIVDNGRAEAEKLLSSSDFEQAKACWVGTDITRVSLPSEQTSRRK